MASKKPMLSVVIPAFNSKQYYQDCLNSLLKINYPNFEVIVVDDGSNDGSLEQIKLMAGKNSRLRVIQTLFKRGIPACRNIGIEAARGDLIAFFDMDMEVTKSWPTELIKVLINSKNIGAVLPKIKDFHQRNIFQSVGGRIVPQTAWVVVRGFGEVDLGQYEKQTEISINAAGVIVKREAVRGILGFDEDLGMFDDLDFGWRLWVAGWKSFYVPKATIYHWTVKPWNKRHAGSPKIDYEYYQFNVLKMIIKNLEFKNLMTFLPLALLAIFVRIVMNLLRGNINPLLGTVKGLGMMVFNVNRILDERRIVQSGRKFSDQKLYGSAFMEGKFIDIYNNHIRKNLSVIKKWQANQAINI